VVANTGGRQTNSSNVWVTLKPAVGKRFRCRRQCASARKLAPGFRREIVSFNRCRIFASGAVKACRNNQFTLQADDTSQVLTWTPKLVEALRKCPELMDLNSDQQQNGLQADLKIDRLTMGRFGLLPSAVDNTLYDAFVERQVSTIYNAMNQYRPVCYGGGPRILAES